MARVNSVSDVRPGELSKSAFVRKFGAVYEESPWGAEAVWPGPDRLEALAGAMRAVVDQAPIGDRLSLIRAHPELAGRARMAEASVREQSGAGLDRCSSEEFAAFHRLNAAYSTRFGFPFIIAVRGLNRCDVLSAFEARLANDAETEFATAMAQIHRIAGFRLADLV